MTIEEVRAGASRVSGVAQRTPLTHSATFSQATGAAVYLKCENLQRTGSFKIRGAHNRLSLLSPPERAAGVVAASAGNHAQGVALAAQLLGIRATVFMPESTPLAKVAATQGYGAEVRILGASYEDALAAAEELCAGGRAILVHPFDDEAVIAGQGTVALEILDDLPAIDAVVVPVGGGGLISGMAVALKALKPTVRVYGVEAAAVPHVHVNAGGTAGGTIADGINVRHCGALTQPLIDSLVDGVVAVEEEDISHAIVMLLERSKMVVEGAGAVGVAAMLSNRLDLAGQTVAVVLSGGNIDINLMAKVIEHGLATAGRYLVFETWLQDRPGELLKLLQVLLDQRVNILSVEHRRPASFPEVEVMLTVETRDADHGDRLLDLLRTRAYRVERLPIAR